jgi:hypothetical protein
MYIDMKPIKIVLSLHRQMNMFDASLQSLLHPVHHYIIVFPSLSCNTDKSAGELDDKSNELSTARKVDTVLSQFIIFMWQIFAIGLHALVGDQLQSELDSTYADAMS